VIEKQHVQSLTVLLDEEDSLDRSSSVRVDDVVRRREMLDEQRHDRQELIFRELHKPTAKQNHPSVYAAGKLRDT
jgi:hypothetical protein